ncbi:DUF397 domain-containing protein [Streptomyces sp. NPDC051567]|uniref:DUF397 domain-containing protein n=1 Tax=Streptomyces sp. NPDC051567 TaxID=3365660 RepID=UPI0037979719
MTQPRPTLADLTHPAWRTSSYSGGQGECIQVADNIPHLVPVRDSKRPAGPVIGFAPAAWRAFVAHLRD